MHTTRWHRNFLRENLQRSFLFFFFARYARRCGDTYAYHPYRERHVQHYQDCGGTEGICFKMQWSAYCVCSLTFHARCWPGDVLSHAPLWCQDRRSLHRRSNNSCSKTQQVSSEIYFRRSGINSNFDFFDFLDFQEDCQVNMCSIFLFQRPWDPERNETDVRYAACCSQFFFILSLSFDTSNSLRNLFRNLFLRHLFQILTICAIASSPFLATSSWL